MGIATYSEALFAANAAAYAALLVLLFLPGRTKRSRTRTLLVAACVGTGGSAAAIAAGWTNAFGPSGAITELASLGGWCAFVLHLLHKQTQDEKHGLGLVALC